ncbi:hypothetical protein DFAR_940013 [Desulfarculales bacterium]
MYPVIGHAIMTNIIRIVTHACVVRLPGGLALEPLGRSGRGFPRPALGLGCPRTHCVDVITSKCRMAPEQEARFKRLDLPLEAPVSWRRHHAEVFTLEPGPGVTVYLISHERFFDRAGPSLRQRLRRLREQRRALHLPLPQPRRRGVAPESGRTGERHFRQ